MSDKSNCLMMILNKLDRREHATVKSLMEDLEVAERTLHRYITTLQSSGFPISYDRAKGSYVFENNFSLSEPGMTGEEKLALHLSRKLLRSFGSGMESSLDDAPPLDLSDDEVRESLDDLSAEGAEKPLSHRTVRLILEIYNNLSYEWYVRELVENPCDNASDFNNRGNALAHLGRNKEALEEYRIASALDPNAAAFLLNRAQLLVSAWRRTEALEAAERTFVLMREGDLQHWQDHLTLALVFLECDRPQQAAICLDRHTAVLRILSPYIYRTDDGSWIVDKDDGGLRIAARIDFAELADLTKRIGGAFSVDPGWEEHLLCQISDIEGRIRP